MISQYRKFLLKTGLTGTLSTISLLLLSPALYAQDAGPLEEIVVKGFRSSIEAALDAKRESANSIEKIVAEDIGKMPDLNLAESLQRVPGVAITREGGEGRQITVRGLGPGYTRTTLNGMEVPASTGGLDSSGGVNRSRSFDFNVFASELFNSITINKSPRASIEEGGLAATVDLSTPKPFNNPGLHVSASGQLTIENISEESDPRVALLFSQTFADDTVGILLSYANSERHVQQEGWGSVRWSFPSSDGDTWFDTTGTTINGTATVPLEDLVHPRLPRTDVFYNVVKREGYTAAVQFRPTDSIEVSLDYVASELDNTRESYNFFAQFRNNWDSITPLSLTLDSSGRYVTAGEYTGVQVRSESRGQFSTSKFDQTVLSGKFNLTDIATLKVMYGSASSKHSEDQYRYNLNTRAVADMTPIGSQQADYFAWNLTDGGNMAEMSYGFDILDPNNFQFSGDTTRRDIVERDNDTFKVDLEIAEGDASFLSGIITNTRKVDSARWNPVGPPDGGHIPGNPPQTDVPALSKPLPIDNFGDGIGAPAGMPRSWLVNDFDLTKAAYGTDIFALVPIDGSTFSIEEKTTGGYFEFDTEAEVLGKHMRVDAGVRVVQTETTSTGSVTDAAGDPQPVTASGTYSDVLPSTNIMWDLTEDLALRLNLARNITRPGLSSMSITYTAITPINGRIARGNPSLDPERADSADIGLEWYFAEDSLLALTVFNKQLSGFITTDTIVGSLNELDPSGQLYDLVRTTRPETDPTSPTYDPNGYTLLSDNWELNTSVNGESATLNGYELAYQQPLPANLGILANYTHVNSTANYGGGIVAPLTGLSEDSYNFTLYYEVDMWGARVTVNSRDDYLTRIPGSNGNEAEATTGPTRVDASAFYNITDNITATLEIINLTNEEERLYTTGPWGDLNLTREFNTTGREILLGARVTF